MSEDNSDFTNDPYWGKGGSYVVDPATGKRSPRPAVTDPGATEIVPAQIGQRPDDAAAGAQVNSHGLAPAADTEKSVKEKPRAR